MERKYAVIDAPGHCRNVATVYSNHGNLKAAKAKAAKLGGCVVIESATRKGGKEYWDFIGEPMPQVVA